MNGSQAAPIRNALSEHAVSQRVPTATHTGTSVTVDDTLLATVMETLDDSSDFRVADVLSVCAVLEAAATGCWRAFTEIEVWDIGKSNLLIVVEAQPGMRLTSEPLSLIETFVDEDTAPGADTVRDVLDQFLCLHRSLTDLGEHRADGADQPAVQRPRLRAPGLHQVSDDTAMVWLDITDSKGEESSLRWGTATDPQIDVILAHITELLGDPDTVA